MRIRSIAVAVLLASALALGPAWAEEPPVAPGAPPPAPAPAEPSSPTGPPAEIAAAPRQSTLAVLAGAGLYESLHLGVGYHTTGRNSFELFLGSNFGLPETNVNTLGASWRHDVDWKGLGLDPALLVRALYWTSRDVNYAWTLFSAEVGASLSREIAPGTRVAIDAAVVRTYTLESDRHQDQVFGSPNAWNGTLCLSISHQLRAW